MAIDPTDKLFAQAGFTTPTQQEPVPPAAPAPTPAPAAEPTPTPAPAAPVATPADPAPEGVPTPNAEPAPAAAQNNDYLKGLAGGKFDSQEAINNYISELESKVATEPFANEYIKGLNEAVRNGVDADVFAKVANVDPKKLSDREALILQHQWKNGFSAEEAALVVDSDFRLGEDEDAESQDVRLGRLKAKAEANGAREFLEGHRADVLTPPTEKQVERQKAAWTPEISKVVQGFKTITVPGKTGNYEFPVSPEVLAKAEKTLMDIVGNGQMRNGSEHLMPDAKGLPLAQSIVNNAIIVDSLPAIMDFVADQVEQKHAVGLHNPRNAAPPAPAPVAPVKSEEQKRAEFLAKEIGIKLRTV